MGKGKRKDDDVERMWRMPAGERNKKQKKVKRRVTGGSETRGRKEKKGRKE